MAAIGKGGVVSNPITNTEARELIRYARHMGYDIYVSEPRSNGMDVVTISIVSDDKVTYHEVASQLVVDEGLKHD